MDTQSGFSNESRGGNGMFASFKDGKITTKVEGEKKTFTTLTGLIVDVDIEDAKFQVSQQLRVGHGEPGCRGGEQDLPVPGADQRRVRQLAVVAVVSVHCGHHRAAEARRDSDRVRHEPGLPTL